MCNKEWSLCHQNAIDDEWFEINVFGWTFTERRWKNQVNKNSQVLKMEMTMQNIETFNGCFSSEVSTFPLFE